MLRCPCLKERLPRGYAAQHRTRGRKKRCESGAFLVRCPICCGALQAGSKEAGFGDGQKGQPPWPPVRKSCVTYLHAVRSTLHRTELGFRVARIPEARFSRSTLLGSS